MIRITSYNVCYTKLLRDHQLRQTRGVRIVALGAGEGVVADVDGRGIDRDAPVEVLVRVVARDLRTIVRNNFV